MLLGYRIRESIRWAYPRYREVVKELLGTDTDTIAENRLGDPTFREIYAARLQQIIHDRYPDGRTIERTPACEEDRDAEAFGSFLCPRFNRLSVAGVERVVMSHHWFPCSCYEFCLGLVKWELDLWQRETRELPLRHHSKLKFPTPKVLRLIHEQYILADYIYRHPERKHLWSL